MMVILSERTGLGCGNWLVPTCDASVLNIRFHGRLRHWRDEDEVGAVTSAPRTVVAGVFVVGVNPC